jgi:hypothetical protein
MFWVIVVAVVVAALAAAAVRDRRGRRRGGMPIRRTTTGRTGSGLAAIGSGRLPGPARGFPSRVVASATSSRWNDQTPHQPPLQPEAGQLSPAAARTARSATACSSVRAS